MGIEKSVRFPEFRIGHGFDVHRWSDDPERTLVLGGVIFPDSPGLEGHSDADVVVHAVTDALLAASGLSDLGTMFPDTDPDLQDADSLMMLETAVRAVAEAGWRAVNVDCTLILDLPKLSPHREQIQRNLTSSVGAPVTVKGKTTEGLAGLGGGVQGHAVALVTAIEGEAK